MSLLWIRKKSPKGKDFWGPPIWTMIHILAICLDPKNSKEYEEFLWLLTRLLPCDYCKKNLAKKIQAHPPRDYLNSSDQAFLYTYMVHDLANQHITKYNPGKPKISPLFEEIKGSYVKALNSQGPKFWGPPIWASIHVLAVTLRQENAEDYKRLLQLLTHLLPDSQSTNNLSDILEYHPIDPYLRNNHDTFFYSYIIHNLINKKLGKGPSPSYDSVKTFYFSALGEECNDCKV